MPFLFRRRRMKPSAVKRDRQEVDMKDRTYIKGFVAGILTAAVAAAGVYAGYSLQDRGVLSDPEHTQKLRYLESLIDREYLEEKDEESLAEGLYAGFSTAWRSVFLLLYRRAV